MLARKKEQQGLIGRFAPSPTGPLHMGSLLAALASYCDIKQRGGRWFVRIDDIDPPRALNDAIAAITRSLEAHGLVGDGIDGDGSIDFQSAHNERYLTARARLSHRSFFCRCSRRALRALAKYPGYCRSNKDPLADSAIRLEVDNQMREFEDFFQGASVYQLDDHFGDFIIWRRDGLVAYNLATAVDDAMDVTEVLRGNDLFSVTAQQRYVAELLGLPSPAYGHLPVLCYADGEKLSKQTHAPALQDSLAASNLRSAATYLGLNPPEIDWPVSRWVEWAVQNWQRDKVPAQLRPYSAEA